MEDRTCGRQRLTSTQISKVAVSTAQGLLRSKSSRRWRQKIPTFMRTQRRFITWKHDCGLPTLMDHFGAGAAGFSCGKKLHIRVSNRKRKAYPLVSGASPVGQDGQLFPSMFLLDYTYKTNKFGIRLPKLYTKYSLWHPCFWQLWLAIGCALWNCDCTRTIAQIWVWLNGNGIAGICKKLVYSNWIQQIIRS